MLRILKTVLVTMIVAAVPTVAGHGQGIGSRTAFINGQDVLRAAPCYSQADSIWQGEVDGYNRELGRLQNYVDSSGYAFQLSSPLLTGPVRAVRLKALRQLEDSVRKVAAGLQDRARDRQRQWFAPIEARINALLDSLRVEGNFDYIIDVSVLGRNILAVRKSLDLTPKVIARLRLHADTSTAVAESNQTHRVTTKDIARLQLHPDSSALRCVQAPAPTTTP